MPIGDQPATLSRAPLRYVEKASGDVSVPLQLLHYPVTSVSVL